MNKKTFGTRKNVGEHILRIVIGILMLVLLANGAGAAPYVYVANSNSNNVSVIDAADNSVAATVNVGISPWGVAVNPDGTKAYITNVDSNNVSIIDTATNNVIATVNVGTHPLGIAINSAGTKAYVANQYGGTVSIIDLATNIVTTVNVESGPLGIAVNPAGTKVYVANYWSNSVSVIDTETNNVISFPVGSVPTWVAVNSAGTKVYVVNSFSHNVYVIDTADNSIIATVNVGRYPASIAINSVGTNAYVTNGADNTVSVIDTTTNNVISFPVGKSPDGVAIDSAGTKAYVTNGADNTVSVIDTTTNNVMTTVNVGVNPRMVAVSGGTTPAPTPTPTNNPTVVLIPPSGKAGDWVQGLGSGWAHNQPINVYWDGTKQITNSVTNNNGEFLAYFKVPAKAAIGDHNVRFTTRTKSPITVSTIFQVRATLPNTFYYGINWKKGDPNVTKMAVELDSTLRNSYANTGWLDGAFQVWKAYVNIPTPQNYLSTNEGNGDYPIAFAYSGGTQTLFKKIESGKVTADYIVLAAPALLEQDKLAKLILDKKIRKKIIILQSTRDILFKLTFGSSRRIIHFELFPGLPLPTFGLKVYPEWKLFDDQDVNNDGINDIITLTDDFPNIPGGITNLDDCVKVHEALRDKMINMFDKGAYPFDGTFEGLKKNVY